MLRIVLLTLIAITTTATSTATSASIILVEFAGTTEDPGNGENEEGGGTFSDIFGSFHIDTNAPASSSVGNYPGAVFGTQVFKDGIEVLSQSTFTCMGTCANDAFVSETAEASVYVQDFFVGNLDLILQPASGVNFDNDLEIFLLAATGNAEDWFDIYNSFGSVQGDTEDSFTLYSLVLTEVSAVPLPAAAWLFLSALGGLFGMRKLRAPQTELPQTA